MVPVPNSTKPDMVPVSKPLPVRYETSIQPLDSSPKIDKNSKSFFDAFNEDEGYYGWFIPDEFKGMKEVWTILLSRNPENSKSGKFAWSVAILTQTPDGTPNEDGNDSIRIKTQGSHLSFRTNKVRGVEYRFKGEFFKSGNQFTKAENVLKGTLQKFYKGRKIAEFTDNFAYYEPQCWH